jgi:signal transduction histidine kinase
MTDEPTVAALRAEIKRKERDAGVLQAFTAELNTTLVLDELLSIVLHTVNEVFGFNHAMVLLLDEDVGVLRVVASRGYDSDGVGAEVKLGMGVVGMVAKKRRIMRMSGMRTRRAYVQTVRKGLEARGDALTDAVQLPGLADVECQIAIPMLIEDTLIGVLAVESEDTAVFDKNEEVLVATIANQAASAIQHAQLVVSLEDRVAERTRELRDAHAQLVQAGKMAALGSLVAGVAHEINTPVASVSSSRDTLATALTRLRREMDKHQLSEAHPKLARLLEVIDDSSDLIGLGSERIAAIVTRLRSFARLDEADMQRIDLNAALEDTVALVKHELKGRVKLDLDFGELPEVACYARQLNQVVLNILINAIHAIEGEGTVELSTRQVGDRVHIIVRDDGKGIDADHRERIFDPGFTTKGVGVGTGLGLAISYRIVQDHHGEIRVESEVGKGTTFTVVVPLELSASSEAASSEES